MESQLLTEDNFVSSTDTDKEQVMCWYNDNIEIIINDKVDEVNGECLDHFVLDIKII